MTIEGYDKTKGRPFLGRPQSVDKCYCEERIV